MGNRTATLRMKETEMVLRLTLKSFNTTELNPMRTFTAIIERDFDTKLYVGYVPGFPGAHSQGETLDELQENLREVIEMLLEDKHLEFETEFVGIQQIVIQSA